MKRISGRKHNQVRPVHIAHNICEYAAGSVIISLGKTKVLCTVIMQPGVPQFLRGSGSGWLTAEYAMLPAATHMRTTREASTMKRNGRNIEISRLIGRALRSAVNLSELGERTIYIDCDVIQADGGTRTASITGAFFALKMAVDCWRAKELVTGTILTDEVAAVSAGVVGGAACVDLNYREDSNAQADFNLIMTRSGKLIEIQCGVEEAPIEWKQFEMIRQLATDGIAQIFTALDRQQQNHFQEQKEKLQGALSRSL